ncbi:predicted protein [Arabidopsis lyrata subsp. lyrata]|uniref:Predicted protein n=1 Tax=Arabidopsis lyrata subsp. lyrata TaxID=81972 RepID=D7KJW6_ARALL|nr:predicted protein [Arabidopsis lyrata subsp. lyrata]
MGPRRPKDLRILYMHESTTTRSSGSRTQNAKRKTDTATLLEFARVEIRGYIGSRYTSEEEIPETPAAIEVGVVADLKR